jgi:hypothetical protein
MEMGPGEYIHAMRRKKNQFMNLWRVQKRPRTLTNNRKSYNRIEERINVRVHSHMAERQEQKRCTWSHGKAEAPDVDRD